MKLRSKFSLNDFSNKAGVSLQPLSEENHYKKKHKFTR